MGDDHLHRAGTTGGGGFTTRVRAGVHTGLRILELAPGTTAELRTGDEELLVLPLTGGCTVACDGEKFDVTGRTGVFDRVTDFAYVPRDGRVEVSSAGGGRFALPSAPARRRLAPRYGAAEFVPVELRGAGAASRQVTNFCTADTFEADRLIAVEVLTPGGNISSYPPHKHDELAGGEVPLEEIYYFEVAAGGPAYQRVYGSGPGREIDVCAEVRTGDVVTIPYGYHGPSIAAPGYDLYYLHVMAGPGDERVWRCRDDPAHAWIRDTWAAQPVDPRLPLTSAGGRS
jgi:5-deoxy-glucuronate isomerase